MLLAAFDDEDELGDDEFPAVVVPPVVAELRSPVNVEPTMRSRVSGARPATCCTLTELSSALSVFTIGSSAGDEYSMTLSV
jgi:hypothetical protein